MQVVADELRALGISAVQAGKAGVTFRHAHCALRVPTVLPGDRRANQLPAGYLLVRRSNDLADGYKAVIWLRAAIRVLLLVRRPCCCSCPDDGEVSPTQSFHALTLVLPVLQLGEGDLDQGRDGYAAVRPASAHPRAVCGGGWEQGHTQPTRVPPAPASARVSSAALRLGARVRRAVAGRHPKG